MLRRSAQLASLVPVALLAPLAAQEQIDEQAVEVLREHGLEKSRVMEHLSWICDVYGPRLTGSPNIRRAQNWAKKTLESWGLKNVHLEEWGPFGRGWTLKNVSVMATHGAEGEENTWPVLAHAKAWSGPLKKVEAEVVMAADLDAETLQAMDLSDKIVMVQTPREVNERFDGTASRFDSERLLSMANSSSAGGGRARPASARGGRGARGARGARGQRGNRAAVMEETARFRNFRRGGQVASIVMEKQPLAVIDRGSKGEYGTVFVTSARGNDTRENGAEVIPQFTLAVEHYNRIARLLKKGIPVKLTMELDVEYSNEGGMDYNVIGEIPGTDPVIGEEIVMVGAHFDSWQSGTGATDNGAGSAVMMEAIRLITEVIKAKGEGPRRTVRIGLWSGEEQGLRGSRAHVTQHYAESVPGDLPNLKPDHAKFSAYYNLDNGTGRVRGVYLQGNEDVAKIFRTWLQPFHDLDAHTLTLGNTGGTDHLAFDGIGLPGFQFIQDPVAYSPRTHHSSMDNWDHAIPEDLQQAATIIASFAWHTAQRDQKLPRKPLQPSRARRGR